MYKRQSLLYHGLHETIDVNADEDQEITVDLRRITNHIHVIVHYATPTLQLLSLIHIFPIFIDGRNSNFFYNLANFRKKIGLKANIEMLYLPDETFKQRNRTFTLYIGQPIEWESLDKSKKPIEWAQEIKRKVYLLKEGR